MAIRNIVCAFGLGLLLIQGQTIAQTQCRINEISLNTGRDPITGTLIPEGGKDTSWKVTSVANSYIPSGNTIPYPSIVTAGQPSYFFPAKSKYISHSPQNCKAGQPATGPSDAKYEITRHFITVKDDSFFVNVKFLVDNYINYFRIDGINYFSSNPTAATWPFTSQNLALSNLKIFLPSGCHDITCSYGDINGGALNTQSCASINLEGSIKSATGDSSLLAESCFTNTPVNVQGNNTIEYCKECHNISPNFKISSLNNCANLDTVNIYFISSYVRGKDTLQFEPQLGISSSFDLNKGILTLYGNANYGVWEQVIRRVCYKSLQDYASPTSKAITIVLGSALFNPANGHFYKLVNNPNSKDWTDARDRAAASRYFGLQGYLVTITDANENDFIDRLIDSDTWMGANDATEEGVWRWVTGCEGLEDNGRGRKFYISPGFYNKWAAGEPNNVMGIENYAHLHPNVTWNDVSLNNAFPFLIEYGCMPGDNAINLSANVLVKISVKKDTLITKSICQGQTFLGYSTSGKYVDTLHAANGCDSIRTLNLTVLPRKTFSMSQTICEGENYLGRIVTGTYRDTLKAANGCDSIRTLNLTVLPRKIFSISESICEGKSFLGRTTSGTYRDTLKAANGCDSIRTLNLTVLPRKIFSINESICEGKSFLGRVTTGTFRDTLKAVNGCDSIRILNLTVLPRKTFSISESICEGQSFLGRTTTGTYRDTLKATNGCDSIRTLNLTVLPRKTFNISESICEGQSFLGRVTTGTFRDTLKAANGCDSIRILNLTVLPSKTFSISESICEGQSFLGRVTTGTFRDTLKAANGCDSIRILNLTVLPSKTFSISESICEGQSFLGRVTTGTFRDTLKAANGCDSIRILNLTVLPRKTFSFSESICEGQSFFGRTATGTYRDTLKAANGCDSIRILNLTVLPRKTFSISETICEGQSFLGRTTSGTYRDTLKAANGCDSIRVLNLTVLPRKTFSISESICEGQSFLDRTASGTYRDTLKATNGCDSIRILNLTVLPRKSFSISQSICEGQSFLGRTTTGTYRDTLKAANGCDSIRILNLTVFPRKTFSISESICEGQSFLDRTASGTYRDTLKATNGCDSIRILNLTVLPRKSFSISQSICEGQSFLGRTTTGTYRDTLKAANGCDSIRILNLTLTPIPKPNLGQDRSFCEGDSIQISPGNFTNYSWQNGATTANIWVNTPGLYWVRVSNGSCSAADTLNIGALFPTPRNFLADTFRLCLGESIEVPGYARYRWSSGESVATYKVKQFGPLSLGVTTTEGCVGTDQTIIVSNDCKLVSIPNAFSPNGDGLNEVFRPTFGVPVTGYQAIIFNRWGQQMQLSSDPLKGWDGRWNGKDAPLGVYYYIIRFADGAGVQHERTGSVTLLR